MVACGLPEISKENASKLAEFAFGIQEDLNNYNEHADIKFQMRIGINCGPVIAGVIGTTKLIYDVWGRHSKCC